MFSCEQQTGFEALLGLLNSVFKIFTCFHFDYSLFICLGDVAIYIQNSNIYSLYLFLSVAHLLIFRITIHMYKFKCLSVK